MNSYIGTKLIKAEVMNLGDTTNTKDGRFLQMKNLKRKAIWFNTLMIIVHGTPKDVFEKAYLKVDDNPVLPSGVSVGPDMVENFIKEKHVSTLGDRTTLVRCVLVNGFEIVESSHVLIH